MAVKAFAGLVSSSFRSKSKVRGAKKGARPTSAPEVPPHVLQRHPANSRLKGVATGLACITKAARTSVQTMASVAAKTAGAFTCCMGAPILDGELKLDIPSASYSEEEYNPESSRLSDEPDALVLAIVKLKDTAVSTGKKAFTTEDAHAIKSETLAKEQHQNEELKVNLAAADAAAKIATGAPPNADLDALLLQSAREVDADIIGDDEAVAGEEWEALMADEQMASLVVKLQAGQKAC